MQKVPEGEDDESSGGSVGKTLSKGRWEGKNQRETNKEGLKEEIEKDISGRGFGAFGHTRENLP